MSGSVVPNFEEPITDHLQASSTAELQGEETASQEFDALFNVFDAAFEDLPEHHRDVLCEALETYIHGATPAPDGQQENLRVGGTVDHTSGAEADVVGGPLLGVRPALDLPHDDGRTLPSRSEPGQTAPRSELELQQSIYRSPALSLPSSPDDSGFERSASAVRVPSAGIAQEGDTEARPTKYRRVMAPRSDESGGGINAKYITDTEKRAKSHSKRMRCILSRLRALNVVSRPHILFYCSRPESVGHQNGSGHSFYSNNLRPILGPTFLEDLHQKVAKAYERTGAASNVQVAMRNNFEVERLRQEKDAMQARLEAALRRMKNLGITGEEFEDS
ncbi:hypothetical protein ACG7TL_006179 [Trametes sanguinea]